MLIFDEGQVVGNTAPNVYNAMKPWKAENGAFRWIIDNATGSDFTDSDGKVYKLRLRTPAELASAPGVDAPANEKTRLQSAFAKIDSHGILTLDNKGAAEVMHSLGSKWYAVSITPLDAAMPDIHIVCQKDKFTVKGGANNGRVTYALTLIAPPKGRENQMLTAPY